MARIKVISDYRSIRSGLIRAGEYDTTDELLNNAIGELLEAGRAVMIEEPKPVVEPMEEPKPVTRRRKE